MTYLVDARVDGGCRAAESDRASGLCLQSQRGELEDVRHRLGVAVGYWPQQGDFRKTFAPPRLETWEAVYVTFVLGAENDGLDGGMPAPQIGGVQYPDAGYVHFSTFAFI